MTHSKALTSLVVFLLLALSLIYAHQINQNKDNFLYKDYGKFYQGARFALEGKSIYSKIFLVMKPTAATQGKPQLKPAAGLLNPPFFTLLILPLGLLSYTASLIIWSILSIFCGVISVLLLQKTLDLEQRSLTLTLGLLLAVFAYYPTFANIQFGQVTLILLPFEIGAWYAIRNNHNYAAALLLGIAASLKPFFALFLLYFLLRREWRALAWFISTILLCALLATFAFGIHTYPEYHAILQHITWYSSSWNASLLGFLTRLFGHNENNTPLLAFSSITIPLFYLLSGVLLLAMIKFVWPTITPAPEKKRDLDFSITIIVMLLLSPLAWLYYFPLLMIPAVVLFKLAKEKQSLGLYLLTCMSIFLSGIPQTFIPANKITASNAAAVFVLSSTNVATLILLLCALFFARKILLAYSKRPEQTKYQGILLLDHLEWITGYVVVLLPSLFSILGVVNSTILFGQTFIPDFTSAILGT